MPSGTALLRTTRSATSHQRGAKKRLFTSWGGGTTPGVWEPSMANLLEILVQPSETSHATLHRSSTAKKTLFHVETYLNFLVWFQPEKRALFKLIYSLLQLFIQTHSLRSLWRLHTWSRSPCCYHCTRSRRPRSSRSQQAATVGFAALSKRPVRLGLSHFELRESLLLQVGILS